MVLLTETGDKFIFFLSRDQRVPQQSLSQPRCVSRSDRPLLLHLSARLQRTLMRHRYATRVVSFTLKFAATRTRKCARTDVLFFKCQNSVFVFKQNILLSLDSVRIDRLFCGHAIGTMIGRRDRATYRN